MWRCALIHTNKLNNQSPIALVWSQNSVPGNVWTWTVIILNAESTWIFFHCDRFSELLVTVALYTNVPNRFWLFFLPTPPCTALAFMISGTKHLTAKWWYFWWIHLHWLPYDGIRDKCYLHFHCCILIFSLCLKIVQHSQLTCQMAQYCTIPLFFIIKHGAMEYMSAYMELKLASVWINIPLDKKTKQKTNKNTDDYAHFFCYHAICIFLLLTQSIRD